jgi:hypothetical protein
MGRKRARFTASVLISMALAFAWQAKVSPVPAQISMGAISAPIPKGEQMDFKYW